MVCISNGMLGVGAGAEADAEGEVSPVTLARHTGQCGRSSNHLIMDSGQNRC